jgi:hypothetical protein
MGIRLAVLLAAVCGAAPLAAQSGPPSFGVGVDLSSRLTAGITFGGTVRLQTEASFQRAKSSVVMGLGSTMSYAQSQLRVGTGLFLVRSLAFRTAAEPFLVYIGPRVGAQFQHSEFDGGVQNETDWWVGAVVGGEYFLGGHFSLGAEGQVTKTFQGTMRTSGSAGPVLPFSVIDIETRGLLVVRFYPG